MAEYTEICKAFTRMCNSFDACCECPINKARDSVYTCRFWMLSVDPEAAEKVIMKWNEKNPVMTNRDKFKEVFGFDPYSKTVFEKIWFEDDYKEPIKED